MSESNGSYKQFGGVDDLTPNTLVVDTLIANTINSSTQPSGLSTDVLIWVKELGVSAEVHTLANYDIKQTLVDTYYGDIVGNGKNLTGLTIDENTTNLWPISTNSDFGGGTVSIAQNKTLGVVEISGGLVTGDITTNTRDNYTHSFVHGTMNTASGDFVHVHGTNNIVQESSFVKNVYLHNVRDVCDNVISSYYHWNSDTSQKYQQQTFVRGKTYTIHLNDLDVSGSHPFRIQTGTDINDSLLYSDGLSYQYVDGSGNVITENDVQNKVTGTLTWNIPMNAPDKLYYRCQFHQGMIGNINIIDYMFTHVEGSGNITDVPYGHIGGLNNKVTGISGDVIRIFGENISDVSGGYGSLLEGHDLSIKYGGEFSYGYGDKGNIAGYASVVGGIDCSINSGSMYSVALGHGNQVTATGAKVFGIDNDISGAHYSMVTGTGVVCLSNNTYATMVGKFPKKESEAIDFSGGEQMLFVVGDGTSDASSNRSDVFYISNKRIGMRNIYTTKDISINNLNFRTSKDEPEKFTSISNGDILILSNWDMPNPAVDCSGTLTGNFFYGDGKYLTSTQNKGWNINATGGSSRYDYYVSSRDVAFVEIKNTALRRDIDLTQLVNLTGSASEGIRWQDVKGVANRNSEYVFMNASPTTAALDFDLTSAQYYGNGTMTRMNILPHRGIAANNLSMTIGQVDGTSSQNIGSLSLTSSDVSGTTVDVLYTSYNSMVTYKKPIYKDLDDVFVLNKEKYRGLEEEYKTTSRLFSVFKNSPDKIYPTLTFDAAGTFIYSVQMDDQPENSEGWQGFHYLCPRVMTYSFWMKVMNRSELPHVTIFTTEIILARLQPNGLFTFQIQKDKSGGNLLHTPDGIHPEANHTYADNEWEHYTITYDNNRRTENDALKIYINGVYKGLQYSYGRLLSGNANYSIKELNSSLFFLGNVWGSGANYKLRDFRIFSRAISQNEVTMIYNGETVGDEVLHMPLTAPNQLTFGGSIRPYGLRLWQRRRQLNAEDYSGYPVSYEKNPTFPPIAAFDSLDNAIEPNKGFDYFPAIDPLLNRLYVGSNIGELYCYSIDKTVTNSYNSLLWTKNMYSSDATFKNNVSVRGIAIGSSNRIYVTATNPGEKWGALYAIDTNLSGSVSEAWRYTINSNEFKYEIETMPTVDTANNMIYFGDETGILHGVQDNGSNYSLNWTLDLSAQIATTASIDSKGILYVVQSVPAPSSLFAINTVGSSAGTIRWKYQTTLGEAGLSYSSPAIDTQDRVYIFTGSDNFADPNYCNFFIISDEENDIGGGGTAVLQSHQRFGPFAIDDTSSNYVNSSSNVFSFPKDFITSPIIDNDGSVIFTHGYQIVKTTNTCDSIDWSFNIIDISNTFDIGLTPVDTIELGSPNDYRNVTFIPTSPVISLDGNIYVSAGNKLLVFDVDTGVMDISYEMVSNTRDVTRCSPVLLNSRGQWGMHGFDSTRRGKRYPII